MDAPSWHRVKEVLQATLAQPPADHAAYVARACRDEPSVQAEVASLLDAIERAGSFMEPPPQSVSLSAAFPSGWIPDLGQRAFEPGSSLGPYRILEFVGAGGMGEVYRAHDTNLDRDVALKVRPVAFALDDDRFARFRREAQILAALNHPNIAAIYGLENPDGVQALVLELVDGPTLAGRIGRGAVPVNETLSIGKQIALGLEAAHRRGIIHSDLKPANINLRPDGTVKILDFGLATALDAVDAGSAVSHGDAATDAAQSHAGLVFGTPAYMSPEQARGEAVDRRSDIWAFGCVLYEALTGRAAFRGQDIENILAAVLNDEPDWSALPRETPASVVRLLRKCLEKNVDRRLHDIADARIEIEDAAATVPAIPRKRSRPALLVWAGVAIVLITTIAVLSVLRGARPAPDAPSTVKRFEIRLPETESLARAASLPLGIGQPSIAITRDGTRLAYVLAREGVTQLYVRGVDQLDATPIPHTEGAFAPFFSPDGRWLGFFAGNKLKKVAVEGGEPIELCDAPIAYGGAWSADGTILFAPDEGRRPARVRETGGTPEPVLVRNSGGSFRHPDILPGGKAAIVSNALEGSVGVLSLDTGDFRTLVERAGGGRYAPTGHLIFARSGTLLAVPFDPEKLAVTGPESVVLEGVRVDPAGPVVPQAVFSQDGTLVYAPGGAARNAVRPVWVDRQGKVQLLGLSPRQYGAFSLSPDGRRLALVIADPDRDLWVQDLERGAMIRLTSGAAIGGIRWWDDERIVLNWRSNAVAQIFLVPSDGRGEPEPLTTQRLVATSLSPDRQLLAGFRQDPVTGLDLWVLSLKGTHQLQPFLRTRFSEAGPAFSPDGRWLAYASNESGEYEIYVRPYPGPGGKWQVSTEGGEHVIWSRDGTELFYRNGRKWMSVAVNGRSEFRAGIPRLLFEGPYVMIGGQSFDVSPDGHRFLVLAPAEQESAPVTHLTVVLNWFEDVRRKTGHASAQP